MPLSKIIMYVNNQNIWISEFIKVLFFGLASMVLGQIRFYMPGVDGGVSDLREVALIISIFYIRHWISPIFVSFITAFSTPPDGSFLSTFLMHAYALIFLYIIYKRIAGKNISNIIIGVVWPVVVGVYFYFFLMLTMVVTNYFVGLIAYDEIVGKFINVINVTGFEVVSSAIITTLFLINLKKSDQLIEQNIDLVASKERAEESDKLKTAFLQNLSHEIRTPMNGIVGFSQLLRALVNSNTEISKYTDMIVNSSNQLLNIVDDIIDASQIDTNQVEFFNSKMTVSELFDGVLFVFDSRDIKFRKRINIKIEGGESIMLDVDLYKVERIIYHLIDNALKYSEDKSVDILCNVSNGYFDLSVRDYGIGIEKENWEIIFESFSQLETLLTRQYGGNGLGLSIAKGFVRLLEGDIWLDSEVGEGSVFYVKIPKALVLN